MWPITFKQVDLLFMVHKAISSLPDECSSMKTLLSRLGSPFRNSSFEIRRNFCKHDWFDGCRGRRGRVFRRPGRRIGPLPDVRFDRNRRQEIRRQFADVESVLHFEEAAKQVAVEVASPRNDVEQKGRATQIHHQQTQHQNHGRFL